jgi:hypothetical protein
MTHFLQGRDLQGPFVFMQATEFQVPGAKVTPEGMVGGFVQARSIRSFRCFFEFIRRRGLRDYFFSFRDKNLTTQCTVMAEGILRKTQSSQKTDAGPVYYYFSCKH